MTWPSTQPPAISTVVQSMVLWFVAKSVQFVLQCHHEYLGTCRGAWSWLRASPYYSLLLCEWWGYGQWKLAIYVNIYVCVSVYAWVIKGRVCVSVCVCSFAKRTRMFYYFIWASKLLLFYGWIAVIFASELRQGNVGKKWILSGLDHIISTQEADPLALWSQQRRERS